jgi:quercetin dioxygenase-like cupin family protein
MSTTPIIRKPLNVSLGSKTVTSVDVRETTFVPGQQTGRHKHRCPAGGFIAKGTAVLEVEGESPQELPVSSSFYEPAARVILRFDNASSIAAMKFIAHYLLHGKQELIEMLPENQS